MNLQKSQFRFPFVDLAIVASMVLIGWATWRLAKADPQIASDRQEAQELREAFKRGRKMAGAGIKVPEGARREASANAANPTTGEQQVLEEALLRADSPTEFAQGLWREPGKGEPAAAAATVGLTPEHQLHQVQYVLLAALAALGVLLILDVYFRMVIQQGVISEHRKELSRLEDQHRQELRQLEQMAAQLAHEIRNRLTTINAWMFTFQRKLSEATPEHKETRVIRGEVKRINEILGEFIQLARPEVPRMARMSAEPLLKEIGELMPPQLHAPGLRLECHAEGKAEFQGDRRQLKEVLENLVQNAAQSMSDESKGAAGGEIILRARDGTLPLKGTETKVVIIEVEDNGPGIRPELKGRLFEPFFSTKEQGTGLGLPICARIIDGHGGILDFDTQVGRGTVFRIVLPAYEDRK